MKSVFQAGGPLPANSPVYVERATDQEMLHRLLDMKYVKLITPRQTGKTSLIFRLRAQLANRDYIIAYVDAEDLDRRNEAAWYQDLCSRLAPQLKEVIEKELPKPCLYSEFRQSLADLAKQATQCSWRLAIALDECGNVPQEWSEDFFKVLREVFTVRDVETYFKNLTFILAGAFDPRTLIKDELSSPFNVAKEIDLMDFDPMQVRQLVKCLEVSGDVATTLADSVYSWTSGQPYLTQKICSLLEERGAPFTKESVEQAANWVCMRDDQHLPFIFSQLKANPEERDYLKTLMLQEAKIRFNPTGNSRHSKLALIGVVKEDEYGNCIVRNRIYEEWLSRHLEITGVVVNEASQEVWVNRIKVPLTEKEYKLIAYLVKNPGKIYSRDEIADAVWPERQGDVSDQEIDQLVSRTRRKLGQDSIETVRGSGYRFRSQLGDVR